MHRHTGSSTESPLCPCLACYGARGGRIIAAADDQIATLRADLAASQREVAALRAEAAARPHDLARLADEVKRCQQIITDLCGLHCTGGSADFDSERLGPNNDALRYLAEIGRVEIVSEQGLRVIGRWKP